MKAIPAELEFGDGCNLIWGASNTGKSFTLKALDFMLGGSKTLPNINERQSYDTIWFGFTIEGIGDFTISRSTAGGAYSLYDRFVKAIPSDQAPRVLEPTHDRKETNNLSRFLLDSLGFEDKFVAKNSYGEKESLSFRHLAHLLLVNETSIQAELSPIESGQHTNRTVERSVFRLLLSGSDDSAIIPVESRDKTKISKATKLELLDEMIADVTARLAEYSDIIDLAGQDARLTRTLESIQNEFDRAQASIRALLDEKQRLATEIPKVGERLDEIEMHLERFAQLARVYKSDMERLEALEEASFLVSLGSGRKCPLCGAAPEAQLHLEGITDADQIRTASIAEVNKIKLFQNDLERTVTDLRSEKKLLQEEFPKLQAQLAKVEAAIAESLPVVDEQRRTLSGVLAARDKVRAGLALHEQKNEFLSKRAAIEKIKTVAEKDKPRLDLSGEFIHEFCKVVNRILREWNFPGEQHVSFDKKAYDLVIDGKLRRDNGKGVRAITHAAFKVALLLYCRERGLPHPGFIVLDTPLLTYRDPIKNPKHGALSDDEKKLAQTTLKQKFFEHLYSIQDLGQFIIFENIDPPANIADLVRVENFHGQADRFDGRIGFFPPS